MENNSELLEVSFWKRTAVLAIGFGVGGAIWGLEAYRGTVGSGEVFTNPFSYILGAVSLAVFGGLALAYLSQINGSFSMSRLFLSKNTLKIVGFGTLGWLVAFLLPMVWVEWMLLGGGILVVGIVLLGSIFSIDLVPFIVLEPSLLVGHLWFHFLLIGAIVSVIYVLILKTTIVRIALWSAGGFAIASLIGPILGNLIGDAFNSLLVSYILTFVFICVIFGVSLAVGMRKEQAEISDTT